jgi:hypothetical protein
MFLCSPVLAGPRRVVRSTLGYVTSSCRPPQGHPTARERCEYDWLISFFRSSIPAFFPPKLSQIFHRFFRAIFIYIFFVIPVRTIVLGSEFSPNEIPFLNRQISSSNCGSIFLFESINQGGINFLQCIFPTATTCFLDA